jgi:hypothetical protein
MLRKILNCIIPSAILFVSIATAYGAELPCVSVKSRLIEHMEDLGTDRKLVKKFSSCVQKYRVCIVTSYPESDVLQFQLIRNVPEHDVANFGVVQTPLNEEPGLCLAGIFSGGSAAAWFFEGWWVKGEQIGGVPMIGQLNSDAIPARTLANIIYDYYVAGRSEQP